MDSARRDVHAEVGRKGGMQQLATGAAFGRHHIQGIGQGTLMKSLAVGPLREPRVSGLAPAKQIRA